MYINTFSTIHSFPYQTQVHAMKLKPIFLFPSSASNDTYASYANMGSFLQYSGARFYEEDPSSVSSASNDVVPSVTTFLSNTYQLEHTIVSKIHC